MAQDAVELIKSDHRRVEKLFLGREELARLGEEMAARRRQLGCG